MPKAKAVGEHVVKPTVELPAGVQVVSVEPARVQLSLWKGKPSRRERR